MERVRVTDWLLYARGLDFRGDLLDAKRLTAGEVDLLYRSHGGEVAYIRNVYDFDCAEKTAFWYVVRDRAMEIDAYPSKKDRQQIRRSLKAYDIKRVDIEEMGRVGYQVFYENWLRFPEHHRPKLASKEEFESYLQVQVARGVEFWVGYSTETGDAAMWETVYVTGSMAVEERERLSYRYKQHYPTYGLNHEIANYYLKKRGLRYVVAGARTATEHSNVQDFLLKKMGFRKAYCKLKVWFRFPFNLIVPCAYPFRKLLPRGSIIRSLLMLVQYSKKSR